MKQYGLCYQGSKNRIAEWVVSNIPHATDFYDLFGGGGAVTHAAILSGKFKHFTFNDLNPLCQGFDHAAFYDWAMRQKPLVIISEYNMPEPDFVAVAQTKVVCTLSAYNNAKTATERLYVPRHQLAEYKKRIGLLF